VLPDTSLEDLYTVLTFLYTGATTIKVKLFPSAENGNWGCHSRSLPLRISYHTRLCFTNKIYQSNGIFGLKDITQ
jgi:hypothetical protein